MTDRKALYVVRAGHNHRNGYSDELEVATAIDTAGRPVFEGVERKVAPGNLVLVVGTDAQNSLATGLYRVSLGSPMVAHELQPQTGDIVRVTCGPSDVAQLAASQWMLLDDGTYVLVGANTLALLEPRLQGIEDRLAVPPPVPAPSPAEIAFTEPVVGSDTSA